MLIAILGAIVFLFLPILPAFTFLETRTDQPTLYYTLMEDNIHFQMTFTHSIHLSEVIEAYEVQPSYDIRLESMKYSDVAIGMPAHAEEGQTLIYEDGIYTLYYDDALLPNFTLFIGDVDYSLNFVYQEKQFDLKKELTRGKSFLFEVKKISLYEKMKGVELHGK